MRKTTNKTTTPPANALVPTTPTAAPTATLSARLLESRYGTKQPTLVVELPRTTPHRIASALAHRIASMVEDATPARDQWIVQIDSERTAIYLELIDGDDAEAARGMAVLESIARMAR